MVSIIVTLFILPLSWGAINSHGSEGGGGGGLGRNYKETCSTTQPCNPIKFLDCKRGICECSEPREMIYDQKSDSCAVFAGYSCLRQMPTPSPAPVSIQVSKRSNNNISKDNGKKRDPNEKYQIACVPNARCSYPEEICKCEFRFYKAPNATCILQKEYREKCSADDQCDKFKFLNCIGGTCTCDKEHRYDPKTQKCIVHVAAKCKIINYKNINDNHLMNDECPDDSTCETSADNGQDNGFCVCNRGFKVTLDGTCGRDYGDKCSVDEKCSDVQFICRNGSCQCKYPLHQHYDTTVKRCISVAGGPCDVPRSKGDYIGCTENSVCYETSSYNFCKCEIGFVETDDGKCVKAYGQRCQFDEECDSVPQLACVNNLCDCPDKLLVYDDKHRVCVSLAGGRCRREANGTNPGGSTCTANSVCIKTNSVLEYGRCSCVRGTHVTPNRLCNKG